MFRSMFRSSERTAAPYPLPLLRPDGDDRVVGTDAEPMRTQQAHQRSQRMEIVGHVSAGLVHDFNNLLTIISGSLETVQARVAQGRNCDAEAHIAAVRMLTQRASATIDRLLALSREAPIQNATVDVSRTVLDCRDLICRAVGPGMAVEVVVPSEPCLVAVEPSQFEAALLNLCLNARDATPGGGRLLVEMAVTCLDARSASDLDLVAGDYVTVRVTDSGAGMSAKTIAQAFEPLFTTKPVGKGTGLGLSMVASFVRQAGGQAHIASEPGRGTAVSLFLPAASPPGAGDDR